MNVIYGTRTLPERRGLWVAPAWEVVLTGDGECHHAEEVAQLLAGRFAAKIDALDDEMWKAAGVWVLLGGQQPEGGAIRCDCGPLDATDPDEALARRARQPSNVASRCRDASVWLTATEAFERMAPPQIAGLVSRGSF
jgi:hypothetical protein